MNFIDLARDVIDLRSFSSIWYWIALAVMWSTLSNWVMGVPSDMIVRARRGDAQSEADIRVLAEIFVNRTLAIVEASGTVMVGVTGFVLSALGLLGFLYGIELCQALFLLILPMNLVALISAVVARNLRTEGYENLTERLRWFRFKVQMLGAAFILLTALWGMWVNVNTTYF